MIIKKIIEKVQHGISQGLINQAINPRKRVGILGACLVKIHKVNTCPPLPIGFLDHHNIGQPISILYFLDKFNLEELVHFFFLTFKTLKSKVPFFYFIDRASE